MTKVRLKYLHCFKDRHGRPRYYFRSVANSGLFRLPALPALRPPTMRS